MEAFSGTDTIKTALQLIRYDIPVLILGKSSIGKSYTLIDITEKWNLSHTLLYIGSEKSENIEGVPKLTDRKEGKEILEYLQPYWFPNADVITQSVNNGRSLFNEFVKDYWAVKNEKFVASFANLHSMLDALSYIKWKPEDLGKGEFYKKSVILEDFDWIDATGGKSTRILNDSKFKLEKHPEKAAELDEHGKEVVRDEYLRDDLKDFCAYLTTILGYGNYWLILDEIDKVEEFDKDKFAPLLHIVRERTLKNFRLIDINDGKGLGIPLGENFVKGGYEAIIKNIDLMLDAGESVLDTRVMSIANKTENIEEALFRRFVQLIAEEVMIWRPEELDEGETKIESCLTEIKKEMVGYHLEQGSLTKGLELQKLEEINLQWQYNFFPKMLNDNDLQGNYFKLQAMELFDYSEEKGRDWLEEKKFTAFFKLLSDNFENLPISNGFFSISNKLYDCLEDELIIKGDNTGLLKKTLEEEIKGMRGILMQKERDLGDFEAIALDISDNLRSTYPSDPKKEMDKFNLLELWTDSLIEYLRGAIFANETDVAPLDVAKFLIPSLVNVFYTEMGNDKDSQVDNAVAITDKLQDFFKDVYSADPTFSLKCNKEATEEAFYGGTKSEISSLSAADKIKVSEFSLFGVDEKSWSDSASGKITKRETEEGFSISMPILVKERGSVEFQEHFLTENFGAVEYINAFLKEEAEDLASVLDKQAKAMHKDPKKDKDKALAIYNAAELISKITKLG